MNVIYTHSLFHPRCVCVCVWLFHSSFRLLSLVVWLIISCLIYMKLYLEWMDGWMYVFLSLLVSFAVRHFFSIVTVCARVRVFVCGTFICISDDMISVQTINNIVPFAVCAMKRPCLKTLKTASQCYLWEKCVRERDCVCVWMWERDMGWFALPKKDATTMEITFNLPKKKRKTHCDRFGGTLNFRHQNCATRKSVKSLQTVYMWHSAIINKIREKFERISYCWRK